MSKDERAPFIPLPAGTPKRSLVRPAEVEVHWRLPAIRATRLAILKTGSRWFLGAWGVLFVPFLLREEFPFWMFLLTPIWFMAVVSLLIGTSYLTASLYPVKARYVRCPKCRSLAEVSTICIRQFTCGNCEANVKVKRPYSCGIWDFLCSLLLLAPVGYSLYWALPI